MSARGVQAALARPSVSVGPVRPDLHVFPEQPADKVSHLPHQLGNRLRSGNIRHANCSLSHIVQVNKILQS